jgi:hypothetical protein
MSRFDKAELEGVIENMEKLLQEETVQTSGPAVEPSSNKDGVTGALDGATQVSVPVCVVLLENVSISDDSTYRILLHWMW